MDKEKNSGDTPEKTLIPQPHGGALSPPFQPGERGNPDGRPKGSRNRATILREMLAVKLKDQDGKLKKNPITEAETITYEEAIDAALVKKALNGHLPAIQEIKDTLHGKIKEVQQIIPPDITAADLDKLTDKEVQAIYDSRIKR